MRYCGIRSGFGVFLRLLVFLAQKGKGSERLHNAPPDEFTGSGKDILVLAPRAQETRQRIGIGVHEIGQDVIFIRLHVGEFEPVNRFLTCFCRNLFKDQGKCFAGDDVSLRFNPKPRSGLIQHEVDIRFRLAKHHSASACRNIDYSDRYLLIVRIEHTLAINAEAWMAVRLPPLRDRSQRRSGNDHVECVPGANDYHQIADAWFERIAPHRYQTA